MSKQREAWYAADLEQPARTGAAFFAIALSVVLVEAGQPIFDALSAAIERAFVLPPDTSGNWMIESWCGSDGPAGPVVLVLAILFAIVPPWLTGRASSVPIDQIHQLKR